MGHVHGAPAPGKKNHLEAQRCCQHAAASPGPGDSDVRLAVPAGAISGISPAFLAPDIFGCPSFELRWVSFSSPLKNHRRGHSILSAPPYSPCPHGWCILSLASLRWLQDTKKSSTTDCWQQKVPESTGTGCSSCMASFPLHRAGVCLLWLTLHGLEALKAPMVGSGGCKVLCSPLDRWVMVPVGRSKPRSREVTWRLRGIPW